MKSKEIIKATETALINYQVESNLALQPRLLVNNRTRGEKVLSSIESRLLKCDEFYLSIAFITEGGIAPLLHTFQELERRGIKGKILTTNYQCFTSPKALRRLLKFTNIDIRFNYVEEGEPGFHTKGYIFLNDDEYSIVIGSSNLTGNAITKNQEWNIEFTSLEHGSLTKRILVEFEELWEKSDLLIDRIDLYERIYNEQKTLVRNESFVDIEQMKLKPNCMQLEFIYKLNHLIGKGASRALLISATGTGKTYASAFAARNLAPAKCLFIVHREQIAKQAIKSFKKVLGYSKKMGLLSGTSKENNTDFLFATMQTISKPENLIHYNRDEFELIIIDEVHHAGAASYQRIMKYFTPSLWLGMTASPERTDGHDIFSLFDHNIAYEIRLQGALEHDLLCPFHYFGITDIEIDGISIGDKTELRNFNILTSDLRVDYIIERANFYGFSGKRIKGLIFCSSIHEAMILSEKFNTRGLRTIVLSGRNNQEERERAIDKLVSDKAKDPLDYIFTVDIFNEGVDIPEVNQVIMLRPTESPIVFVQQLGRGLRKAEGKEFVIIIDFIGNYQNNFMIPIALSGDRTYNKDNIRRYVMEGNRLIPGASTIHFDEISKERIFKSIDKLSTKLKLLKDQYFNLKFKLGRIPKMIDFLENGEVDPYLFVEYSGSYYNFISKVDSDNVCSLERSKSIYLEFISSQIINGKRIQELEVLEELITNGIYSNKNKMSDNYINYISALRILQKLFINTQTEKKKFEELVLVEQDKYNDSLFKLSNPFREALMDESFKALIIDCIDYGKQVYRDKYYLQDRNNMVVYQKYSRKEVCRLLNWEIDESSTIYGYKIKYNTCPIFVTYHKSDHISSSTKYEDEFIDQNHFSWMTRNKVRLDSKETIAIKNYKKTGLRILLFIKKSDGEGNDFYYFGEVEPYDFIETVTYNDLGKSLPIVNILFKLKHTVKEDIYDYFVS